MRYPTGDELPEALEQTYRKAIRLEWISLVYWLSAVVLLYFTLGQSQAMKAAWVEDILALLPPIAFLIASRFRQREPDGRFPWGYHRAITVAYTVSSLALLALGVFILVDSIAKLLEGTHPPIGMVEVFDAQIWLGWLMLGALAYSGIPPLILGRLKLPLSADLHDKVLFADAKMNRADLLTASAAAVGVVGIGFGLWWADSVAAIAISLDIVHDGQKYLRESVADLMDDAPKKHDEDAPHPVIGQIKDELATSAWIREAAVRLREHGHTITGDVLVVPHGEEEDLVDRAEELTRRIGELDWKVHGVVVSLVRSIDDAPADLLVRRGE